MKRNSLLTILMVAIFSVCAMNTNAQLKGKAKKKASSIKSLPYEANLNKT